MPRASFHQEARAEFDEAAAFYSVERPSVGEAFIVAIEDALTQVQQHPEIAPLVRGRVRRLHVERFPYSVVYSVVGDAIRVLAVAHDRRRPFYWAGRR
jgi:plasmid stabilization system protein ParE